MTTLRNGFEQHSNERAQLNSIKHVPIMDSSDSLLLCKQNEPGFRPMSNS
jgi:hypothetical protein